MKKENQEKQSKLMRKLIDLSPDVIEKLSDKAIKDNRKLKPYMEKILIEHAQNPFKK